MQYVDEDIVLFHTPGHTIDSICIYDGVDAILHAGDMIGDTMDEIIPSLETSKDVYYNSLCKMSSYKAKYYTSGHNQVLTNYQFTTLLLENETL